MQCSLYILIDISTYTISLLYCKHAAMVYIVRYIDILNLPLLYYMYILLLCQCYVVCSSKSSMLVGFGSTYYYVCMLHTSESWQCLHTFQERSLNIVDPRSSVASITHVTLSLSPLHPLDPPPALCTSRTLPLLRPSRYPLPWSWCHHGSKCAAGV